MRKFYKWLMADKEDSIRLIVMDSIAFLFFLGLFAWVSPAFIVGIPLIVVFNLFIADYARTYYGFKGNKGEKK